MKILRTIITFVKRQYWWFFVATPAEKATERYIQKRSIELKDVGRNKSISS